MMRLAAVVAGACSGAWLIACGGKTTAPTSRPSEPTVTTERNIQFDLVAELQDEIMKSYLRDEPPEIETVMVVPSVGALRLGVAPGDVWLGDEMRTSPTRWPLELPATMRALPRSKNLSIGLAADRTAAWVTDDVSWRITLCGRAAVVPLRWSALFARDGERWVLAFEHLSFGHRPLPTATSGTGRPIATAVATPAIEQATSPVVSGVRTRSLASALGGRGVAPDATLIGVDVGAEWRGEAGAARLIPGTGDVVVQGVRLGTVGRTPASATIAYWVASLAVTLPAQPGIPAGTAQLRASLVLEKRDVGWVLVSAHVAQPIDDGELASTVFGTALLSYQPLAVSCEDAPVVPVRPDRQKKATKPAGQ